METERAPAPEPIKGELVLVGERWSGVEKLAALLRDRGVSCELVYASDIERGQAVPAHVVLVGEFIPMPGSKL